MWGTRCTFIACYVGNQLYLHGMLWMTNKRYLIFFVFFTPILGWGEIYLKGLFFIASNPHAAVGEEIPIIGVLSKTTMQQSYRRPTEFYLKTWFFHRRPQISWETPRFSLETSRFSLETSWFSSETPKHCIGDPKTFHWDPKWGSLKTRQWWSPMKRGFRQYSNDDNFFLNLILIDYVNCVENIASNNFILCFFSIHLQVTLHINAIKKKSTFKDQILSRDQKKMLWITLWMGHAKSKMFISDFKNENKLLLSTLSFPDFKLS